MPRTRAKGHSGSSQPGHTRRIYDEPHDVYGVSGKLPEPAACPQCGALYHKGRWSWNAVPADAHAVPCPACRRIHDRYPDGIVTLTGAFAMAHREEIEGLLRHVEEREKAEHPLKRIIGIEEVDGEFTVTTTSGKLAHAMGEALFHAYRGKLEQHQLQTEGLVRMHWTRE
jgi:hypothetical protein